MENPVENWSKGTTFSLTWQNEKKISARVTLRNLSDTHAHAQQPGQSHTHNQQSSERKTIGFGMLGKRHEQPQKDVLFVNASKCVARN